MRKGEWWNKKSGDRGQRAREREDEEKRAQQEKMNLRRQRDEEKTAESARKLEALRRTLQQLRAGGLSEEVVQSLFGTAIGKLDSSKLDEANKIKAQIDLYKIGRTYTVGDDLKTVYGKAMRVLC